MNFLLYFINLLSVEEHLVVVIEKWSLNKFVIINII